MCVLYQNNDTLEIICSAEKFGKILAILRPISKVLVMLLKVIEKHSDSNRVEIIGDSSARKSALPHVLCHHT